MVLVFVSLSARAQEHKPWSVALTLGLNSPLVNNADTTQNTVYIDEWGLPKPGTETISGQLLVPPISLDIAKNITERFSLGVNAMYQAHTQKTVLRSSNAVYISESSETKYALLLFAEANFMWFKSPPFSLSSGGGLGYGFSNLENSGTTDASALCFDLRLVTLRYALCCGWHLLVDGRYTSSPTGLNKAAGYSIGLGVGYSFNQ
jgi:hypothetical protein